MNREKSLPLELERLIGLQLMKQIKEKRRKSVVHNKNRSENMHKTFQIL